MVLTQPLEVETLVGSAGQSVGEGCALDIWWLGTGEFRPGVAASKVGLCYTVKRVPHDHFLTVSTNKQITRQADQSTPEEDGS